MNTTTAPKCKFQAGMTVEVSQKNFKLAGMPDEWVTATVEDVTHAAPQFDVQVRMPDGRLHVERVGSRGGNKRIRVAA